MTDHPADTTRHPAAQSLIDRQRILHALSSEDALPEYALHLSDPELSPETVRARLADLTALGQIAPDGANLGVLTYRITTAGLRALAIGDPPPVAKPAPPKLGTDACPEAVEAPLSRAPEPPPPDARIMGKGAGGAVLIWIVDYAADAYRDVLISRPGFHLIDALADMVQATLPDVADWLADHGRDVPSSALQHAARRLRAQGLVSAREPGGRSPVLELTADGRLVREAVERERPKLDPQPNATPEPQPAAAASPPPMSSGPWRWSDGATATVTLRALGDFQVEPAPDIDTRLADFLDEAENSLRGWLEHRDDEVGLSLLDALTGARLARYLAGIRAARA